MFEPLPENAEWADVAEARSKAFRRLWRYSRVLVPLSLIGFGAILWIFGAALVSGLYETRPKGPAVRTLAGTVVGIETKRRSGEHDVYAPIVRFTADGREHQFTGEMFESPPRWRVGQPLEVLYDATTGEMAIGGLSGWLPAIECPVAGVALLALGSVLWRRKWWLRPGLW